MTKCYRGALKQLIYVGLVDDYGVYLVRELIKHEYSVSPRSVTL